MYKSEAIAVLRSGKWRTAMDGINGAEELLEAAKVAVRALSDQREREIVRPLTLRDLRKMNGEPVWIIDGDEPGHWELSADALDYLEDREAALYGVSWWAYRTKVREV